MCRFVSPFVNQNSKTLILFQDFADLKSISETGASLTAVGISQLHCAVLCGTELCGIVRHIVQNCAARLILCVRKHYHVTPSLKELHWLSVEQRIIFKILLLTFKDLNNNLCPSYISLHTFHMRSLRRILGISWQDKVPNTEVLSRAGLPSMFTLLRQRRLRWLGHVHRMPDGRIPKDLLYGELATGSRHTGRPQLRYRDVVKRDMKAVDIDTETWENLAADRSQWRGAVTKHLKTGEDKLTQAATERRVRRKLCVSSVQQPAYTCNTCNKDCHSRIGLQSHSRRCSSLAHN